MSSIVSGTLSQELEVKATAAEAWNIYGTLKLMRLAAEKLPEIVHKFELLEGDGGVGTLLKVTFPPGNTGPTYLIEKFTVVDDEKRLKVVDVMEGGHLTVGFTQFRVRFQVKENNDNDSCITKITTEYEIGEDAFGKVPMASAAMPYVALLKVIAHSLTDKVN